MIERLHNDSGYSLVEVLAAIVILTVAIIPMVTMFDTGLRSATTSGNYDKARSLSNANLEQAKAMQFSSAEALSSCPIPPTSGSGLSCSLSKSYVKLNFSGGSGTFVAAGASDPKVMLKVVVTVPWAGGNSYSTTGLISK